MLKVTLSVRCLLIHQHIQNIVKLFNLHSAALISVKKQKVALCVCMTFREKTLPLQYFTVLFTVAEEHIF